MSDLKRFIDHYNDENVETQYSAGIVYRYENDYIVAYNKLGAEETFSVGQPVYDKDGNLMGYLGIGMYWSLDYSTEGQIRIPVEHWMICLPTKYCVVNQQIYTYWQNKKRSEP